jgi:RNA polymerase sigma factor (sigma-70 family)
MEDEFITRYKNGESDLIEGIVTNYEYLVTYMVSNYADTNLDLEELMQKGYMGLLEALDKYEINKEYIFISFENFAKKFIDKNIIEYIYSNYYKKYISEYYNSNKEVPSNESIMEYLGITEEVLNKIISLENNTTRDVKYNSNEVLDFVCDNTDAYTNDDLYFKDISLVAYLKNNLTNIEYYVIYYRYILQNSKSIKEIANILGITPTRVQQIEAKALRKIKRYLSLDIPHLEEYNKGELYPIEYIKNVVLVYLEDKLSNIEYLYAYYSYYLNYTEDMLKDKFIELGLEYNKEKCHEVNNRIIECINYYDIILKEVRTRNTAMQICDRHFDYILHLKEKDIYENNTFRR